MKTRENPSATLVAALLVILLVALSASVALAQSYWVYDGVWPQGKCGRFRSAHDGGYL